MITHTEISSTPILTSSEFIMFFVAAVVAWQTFIPPPISSSLMYAHTAQGLEKVFELNGTKVCSWDFLIAGTP